LSPRSVNTVTGPIPVDRLGVTLMHEHLVMGIPGWQADTLHPGPGRREMLAICCERIQAMQDRGISSLLDPCPNDMGRDPQLAAEVSARTGFNIICATGLFTEHDGAAAYWQYHRNLGTAVEAMAEVFIRELTVGIGASDIKAGIIKIGSGAGQITEYEQLVLEAAAIAAVETGAPITTHTDQGTMGDVQQKLLLDRGVPAHRILIGHSCGSTDNAYHSRIAEGGSYLGFDRFGLELILPDEERINALVTLLRQGCERQLFISHDSVWCFRGQPFPPALLAHVDPAKFFNPTHIHEHIIPALLDKGITRAQIETLLVDNPRRFFSDTPPG